MFRDNLVRLRHMADAAREAIAFAEHRRREDLDHDRMLALSLVKCIEIVGEAASHVSDDFCREHPEIPWRHIVGMRHRLIHAYYSVDMDRVWDTITDDLPPLLAALESMIESLIPPPTVKTND